MAWLFPCLSFFHVLGHFSGCPLSSNQLGAIRYIKHGSNTKESAVTSTAIVVAAESVTSVVVIAAAAAAHAGIAADSAEATAAFVITIGVVITG